MRSSATIVPEDALLKKDPEPDKKVGNQRFSTIKKIQKQKLATEDKVSRIERYEELDKNHPLNKPFHGSSSFRGPIFNRKYTNLFYLLLFIIANCGFLFYGVLAWKDGASGRLTRGMDFRAEICGMDKLKSKKFLYYANPAIDLNVKFCVDSCPTTAGQKICLYDVDPKVLTPFCYTQTQTKASGIFCLPVEPINRKILDNDLSNVSNLIKRIAGDMNTSLDLIAIGLVIALIMAAIYLHMMFDVKKIKYIVWGSIWCTVLAILFLGGFFYKEYLDTINIRCIQGIDKRDCGGFRAMLFKIAAYVSIGLAVFYMLLIMKIFNRINLGLGVLKAAAQCATIFSRLKFVPWALSIFLIFVATFFVLGTVLGFSVGEIIVIPAKNIDGGYVKTIEYSNLMRYLVGFNFFMFQWWLNVLLLISDTILAYSLSIWYFERRKEALILPTSKIVKDVLKFHIGSIIMLGLFKIVFRPVRMMMSLITTIMKKPKQHLNIVRFLQACCMCCLHLHERALRYQRKHAIVQIVIWSESFSSSSRRAYFLLLRHKHRVRNLDSLCTFILFLTKVVCALVGGLFVYAYISLIPKSILGTNTKEIETPLAPTALVFYLGFFFASIFQSALDIANKTLLQCYLMDEEMFIGEQRFDVKSVRDFMDFYLINKDDGKQYGKLQQYVKGMKATLNANVIAAKEEDPDEEDNRKLEKKLMKKKSSDNSEEEDEEDPEKLEKKKKSENSNSDSKSSESEEESEESEEEDETPALLKGNIFGSSMATSNSLTTSQIQNVQNMSKSNLSAFGKSHYSEKAADKSKGKVDEDDEEEEEKKNDETPKPKLKLSDLNRKNDDKSTSMLFPGWGQKEEDNNKKNYKNNWKQMEQSVISNNQSVMSQKLLASKQDVTANDSHIINLQDASSVISVSPKVVEKANVTNNTIKGDKHNVFNRSRIAQESSTIKLEYDDDDDDNMKYRL